MYEIFIYLVENTRYKVESSTELSAVFKIQKINTTQFDKNKSSTKSVKIALVNNFKVGSRMKQRE